MADATDFELYRLLVEEARETRAARRDVANTFLTLNLAGVGALGFLVKEKATIEHWELLLVWSVVALVLVCMVWRTSIGYYTRIIQAKFDVINYYEGQIGRSPMQDEWAALKSGKRLSAFTLERSMPYLFIGGYVAFLFLYLPPTMLATLQELWASGRAAIGM